ncbi:MAG: hypothetical protein QM817_05420 [Archangium sp.]
MRRFITAAFAVCTAAACGPLEEDGPREVPPDEVFASQSQEVRRDADDDGIIIMNGLEPLKLANNLLLQDEYTRSDLISRPLATASFYGSTYTAVRYDPASARVLQYLTRCALSPNDPAIVVNGTSYKGELSLCRAWATGGIASNVTCQSRITACMLGLSNALGAHVPISMRGQGTALTAATNVRPFPFTSSGTKNPVLNACTTTTYGVSNDCGWQPVDDAAADNAGIAKIFACTPDTQVRVGAGSRCDGVVLGTQFSPSDKVLRVCEGIGPCTGAASLGQSQGACGSIRPEVRFTCPSSGLYNVMQRDYALGAGAAPSGTMTVGHYNSLGWAPESSIFRIREGAFFGSLFTGPLGRQVKLSWDSMQNPVISTTILDPVAYPSAYSCEDSFWRDEVAYRTARLCTLEEGGCLSKPTGVCQGTPTQAPVCTLSGTIFKDCRGGATTYGEALTTFLRGQCDSDPRRRGLQTRQLTRVAFD